MSHNRLNDVKKRVKNYEKYYERKVNRLIVLGFLQYYYLKQNVNKIAYK